MTLYLTCFWKYEFVKYIDHIDGMYITACEIYDYIDIYIYKEFQKSVRNKS
ncbi:hypothetical protein HanRHA438_Chr08g0371901 [Helianthus annuus]|nr:hypothetical protein HanRHA438_Chr08g0371901 [Helianthus annuus]